MTFFHKHFKHIHGYKQNIYNGALWQYLHISFISSKFYNFFFNLFFKKPVSVKSITTFFWKLFEK